MKCHKICDAADAFSDCCATRRHVLPTAWRILLISGILVVRGPQAHLADFWPPPLHTSCDALRPASVQGHSASRTLELCWLNTVIRFTALSRDPLSATI